MPGYLDDPERLRCQIYREQDIGHGDVTLADALAQSCNVYFFHHVGRIGGVRLVHWASRFGFGRRPASSCPTKRRASCPRTSNCTSPARRRCSRVGQGAFTATPLQFARLYAAIANGGYLVMPTITRERPARRANAAPAATVRSLRMPG